MPIPIPLIAAGMSLAGGLISRQMSKGDINRQNRYNAPAQQLARLREAGMPAAAMGNTIANSQSQTPQASDLGMSAAGGHISQYVTTQMQMKQLEIAEAELRSKNAEANKLEAEAKWLLSGAGEDTEGTNLTKNLAISQSSAIQDANAKSLSNKILGVQADNAKTRTVLENTKLSTDIQNALKQGGLINVQTEGSQIHNRIQNVLANFQERMSNAELGRLLAQNGLLNTQKRGAELDNALSEIRNRISANTEQAQVNTANVQSWLTGLSYDRVKAEFNDYQEYQSFVQKARDWINNPAQFGAFESMEALIKFLYTSVTSPTGQASGQILQGAGGSNQYLTPTQ